MSFAERFKGKVSLIGKEGTFASLDANIVKGTPTKFIPTVSKSIQQLPPKTIMVPQLNSHTPHQKCLPIFIERNKEKFDSLQDIPTPTDVSNNYPQPLIQVPANIETPALKISIGNQPQKSSLQKAGFNYIYQPYGNLHPKYFPSAPSSNIYSGLSSKGLESRQFPLPKSVQNGTEYRDRHFAYKPYTIKDYQQIKPEKYNKMGGLGPNIGTDDWKSKIIMRKEMLEFGSKITQLNKEKLASCVKRSSSPKKESKREKAIEYSKKLKQMVHESIPMPSYSKQVEDDLNKLQEQHEVLAREIEKIKNAL
jgi:hypothetical protein